MKDRLRSRNRFDHRRDRGPRGCVCGHVEHYSPPGETSCLIPECPCVTFQVDVREDGATALEVATKALEEIRAMGTVGSCPPFSGGLTRWAAVASRALATIRGGETKSVDEP